MELYKNLTSQFLEGKVETARRLSIHLRFPNIKIFVVNIHIQIVDLPKQKIFMKNYRRIYRTVEVKLLKNIIYYGNNIWCNMSQSDVYEILKGLGGRASSNDISKRAHEKYPNRTLYQYVGDRLKKLERKKIVRKVPMAGKENYWEIIDPDFKDDEIYI